MQRYFLDNSNEFNEKTIISSNENKDVFHHLKNVLRIKNNTKINFVVDGKLFEANVKEVKNDQIEFENKREIYSETELMVDSTIIIPLLKSDHNDFLIQKATELGVKRIIITEFKNSVVKMKDDKKLNRYQKIVKAASEQSKRLLVPEILYFKKISDIDFSQYEQKIVAYEENAKSGEKSQLSKTLNEEFKSIVGIFGPEGGFD